MKNNKESTPAVDTGRLRYRLAIAVLIGLTHFMGCAGANANKKGETDTADRQLAEAAEKNDNYGVMSALINKLGGYGIGLQPDGTAIACHAGMDLSLTRTSAQAKARKTFAFAHNNPKVREILEQISGGTRRTVSATVDASGIQARVMHRKMPNGRTIACSSAKKLNLGRR